MILCIDIGNTRIKLGVFSQSSLIELEYLTEINQEILQAFVSLRNIQSIIYSSVRINSSTIFEEIKQHVLIIELNEHTPLPIKNNYQTPVTLGKDRLSAIVGAHNIFPQSNVMVLNAGTALTIDYLLDGAYCGGNISLGMQMRFQALHHFTQRLPLVVASEQFEPIGTNTNDALVSGVQQGMIHEMEGYIDAFLQQSPTGKVILSGGDGFFFENKIKRAIFARPNLVLEGLHDILTYNIHL